MHNQNKENTSITITSRAAKKILELIKQKPTKKGLRISVEGGGCSGFSYTFSLIETPNVDDIMVEKDNAIVFIDSISLPYLKGSSLDFINHLMEERFAIENPQAVSSCGCGTSFSL